MIDLLNTRYLINKDNKEIASKEAIKDKASRISGKSSFTYETHDTIFWLEKANNDKDYSIEMQIHLAWKTQYLRENVNEFSNEEQDGFKYLEELLNRYLDYLTELNKSDIV